MVHVLSTRDNGPHVLGVTQRSAGTGGLYPVVFRPIGRECAKFFYLFGVGFIDH